MSSTLYVDKIVEKTSAAGVHIPGHVIQMVEATYATVVTNTTTSFVNTGLSVTITPKSASSKIIIMVNQVIQQWNNSNYATGRWKIVKVLSGTTSDVQTTTSATNGNVFTYDYGASGINRFAPLYLQAVEVSGSTTARSYTTQIAKGSNGGQLISSSSENNPGNIIVMEVSA